MAQPNKNRVQNSLISISLITLLLLFSIGLYQGGLHLVQLESKDITLDELPSALTLSFLRMLIAYFASLIMAYGVGLLAATNRLAERFVIPALDILQSIPVVGFFPAAISFFIGITQGHRLGVEWAATFLIFTSQAWNLAFAVYESVKTIPHEHLEAVRSFGARGSLKFWRLYAPATFPRLVYNSMLSWSNGWFFLVACEIIAVGNIQYDLPGIGSFLAKAAEQDAIDLVIWGLLALAALILMMDLLVWRPLSDWSDKFKQDHTAPTSVGPPTLFTIASFAQWVNHPRFEKPLGPIRSALKELHSTLTTPLIWLVKELILPLIWDLPFLLFQSAGKFLSRRVFSHVSAFLNRWGAAAELFRVGAPWTVGLGIGVITGYVLFQWLRPPWPEMVKEIPLALLASTGRLAIAMMVSLAWILPLVLWTWDRPRTQKALTTIAQIGASLPAVALFPLFIFVLVQRIGGGMEFASILLLMTAMQWYILFNCLGGATNIPSDLTEVLRSFGGRGPLLWKRLVMPAMRPALITGLVTAWGGGWNALFLSEYIIYKNEPMSVHGIGSLLNTAVYQTGDERAMTLCIAAMVLWILLLNSFIWRPLYQNAVERYRLEA